jgi:hypothetical protein
MTADSGTYRALVMPRILAILEIFIPEKDASCFTNRANFQKRMTSLGRNVDDRLPRKAFSRPAYERRAAGELMER